MDILIVEDHEISSTLLSMLLKNAGCTFDIATTGIQAIKLYFSKPYDLLLMDLGLPDLSGLNVIKFLRLYKPYRFHTPIAVITAHDNREGASNTDVDWFFTKPVESKSFLNLINKLKFGLYTGA